MRKVFNVRRGEIDVYKSRWDVVADLSLSSKTSSQLLSEVIMRIGLLSVSVVALSRALVIDKRNADSATELYTIELEPGVTREVTEDEKWKLKAVSEEDCCRLRTAD